MPGTACREDNRIRRPHGARSGKSGSSDSVRIGRQRPRAGVVRSRAGGRDPINRCFDGSIDNAEDGRRFLKIAKLSELGDPDFENGTCAGRQQLDRSRECVGAYWRIIYDTAQMGIAFLVGLLGFTGISAASADVARILFYIFVVIFLVLLILGLTIFRV
jgi:uncharacterized membrane protein YtjA (UPF0391 family)